MKKVIFSVLFLMVFLFRCETAPEQPAWDNPTDPESPTYVALETNLTGELAEAEVIATHTVTFRFSGNANIIEYSWRLDQSEWSVWQTDTTVTFEYLDEGDHIFQVKGRYNVSQIDETPAIRNFVVNAVTGPALMFSPRKVEVAINTSFYVDVVAEEVNDLMGAYLEIPVDSPVELVNYQVYSSSGEFLAKNGGSMLVLDESIDGILKVNLALANANPAGVTGTGKLLRMELKLTASQNSEVQISSNSDMKDSDIRAITINERVSLVIEVK